MENGFIYLAAIGMLIAAPAETASAAALRPSENTADAQLILNHSAADLAAKKQKPSEKLHSSKA